MTSPAPDLDLDAIEAQARDQTVVHPGPNAYWARLPPDAQTLALVAHCRALRADNARLRAALETAVDFLVSEQKYGPLFQAWESGEIGCFDGRELDFDETLERILDGQDVRTGLTRVDVIEVYRSARAALAGPGAGEEG